MEICGKNYVVLMDQPALYGTDPEEGLPSLS